jgi:hypothetical protein
VPREKPESEVMSNREADQEALRAFHLDRVFSKFKTTISAENAELLAGLLGNGEEDHGNAA